MKAFGFIFLLTALSGFCHADVIYDVNLNTAPLEGNGNGPFALDFQLTSGDTTTGVVNAATLSQFSFGAAGRAGVGNPFPNGGNASGSLGSAIKLNTSGGVFFNEFSQYFTPGDSLSFQLDVTNNPQTTGTPDEFTFQLIDGTASAISTMDPSGSGSLFAIDLTGASLQPQVYTTNGDGVSITPKIVSAAAEPGMTPILVVLGATFGAQRRLRRKG